MVDARPISDDRDAILQELSEIGQLQGECAPEEAGAAVKAARAEIAAEKAARARLEAESRAEGEGA